MKATVEISDELIRRAQAEAARRGVTLDQLVQSSLSETLVGTPVQNTIGKRVEFPIFTSKEPGALCLTNDEIRRMEDEDDSWHLGLSA